MRVALTPKAFDVLRYLVERAGQLVNHNELLDDLWPRAYVQPEVLKHQVLELRKVLGDDARRPRYIETLPRRGYRFIASIRGGFEEAPTAEVGPAKILLVGREEAFTELHDCLARASQGQRQIAGSQRGHREIVNALKEGRDADAVKRLAKHVYNAYEMFRRETEASRAGPNPSPGPKRNQKTEVVGGAVAGVFERGWVSALGAQVE